MPLFMRYNKTKVKVATEPESKNKSNHRKDFNMDANFMSSMMAGTFLSTAASSFTSVLDPLFHQAEVELIMLGKKLCVVALMFCGIKYAFTTDVQSAKNAKDWAMRILAGLVIMILASDIIPLFVDMVSAV